jgi:hypothetical protein
MAVEQAVGQHISCRYTASCLLILFCFIVGFQPVFANKAITASGCNPATIVFAEAVLSSGVGLFIAWQQEGKHGVRQVLSYKNILFFAPTSFLRAIEDVLSIFVLRFIDPVTYIVITQLRLILVTGLSSVFLNKAPSAAKVRSVVSITLYLLMFGFADDREKKTTQALQPGKRTLGIFLVCFAVLCKVTASLWVEFALKKTASLSIPIQSANISIGTMVPSFCFIWLVKHFETADGGAHSPSILAGWGPVICLFVVYILSKNWMGNTVIKQFDAIVKYVVYAAAMPVTYVFGLALKTRQFNAMTFLCILSLVWGVYVFALESRAEKSMAVQLPVAMELPAAAHTVSNSPQGAVAAEISASEQPGGATQHWM